MFHWGMAPPDFIVSAVRNTCLCKEAFIREKGRCNVSGRKACWEEPTRCFESGGHVVGRIKRDLTQIQGTRHSVVHKQTK